jgi:hypothetical protein
MIDKESKLTTTVAAITNAYLKTPEAYARVKVCESCDKYLERAKICAVCKCFIPVKSRLRYAKCPEDKWEKPVDGTSS